jgi:hypothetical protein
MNIEQLRAAVDAAGPREPGRRFSPELREQLIAATHRLWASGEALADIADALGITTPDGFVIDGLDVDAVAALLLALRW